MAVQNIECQIATVLMKRFLDGDNLPQNLLDDLERHLKACTSCQAILNNETNDIEEILDQKVPAPGMAALFGRKQLQPAMAGGFATTGASEALMNASYRTQVAPAPGLAVLKNPKVLFLSLALAAVLIVMSTLLKNPTNLLGPKAAKAIAGYSESKDENSEAAKPEDHSETKPTEEHPTDAHEATDEGHAAEDDVETPEGDTHATETDSHADPKSTEGQHGAEPVKQPEMVNDPRVPGKPTLDQSDLIIAGGKNSTEHKEDSHEKTTSTSSHQTTTTPSKPKTTTHAPSKTRKTTTKRTTSKPKTKSSGGGGIKVYDPSGKPISH
jgi:hypothetical protein